MLLTWFRVGVEFMLVVRAMLTPLATMLPAALTRLIAATFCWAEPDRSMLEVLVAVTLEPSTAMFCAAAEPMLTAPSTLLTTWSFLTALLLLELESVVASVMAVLVVVLCDELVLWFEDEFFAELLLLLLALLEAEALCEALLLLDELASCAALEDVELVVALAFLAVLAVDATFELELLAEADWLALLLVLASVLAAFLAALFADALLDALASLAALPLFAVEFAVDAELF